jgi:hypothetical protein
MLKFSEFSFFSKEQNFVKDIEEEYFWYVRHVLKLVLYCGIVMSPWLIMGGWVDSSNKEYLTSDQSLW